MEWTSAAIKVWFFPRDSIPSSITSGSPDVSDFGSPVANMAGGCDIDTHFSQHSIIFDNTFCGSWGGNVFESQGCPMTSGQESWPSCVTYVAENPDAFTDAYWTVNSIKVYQAGNEAAAASSASSYLSSVTPAASTASNSLTSESVGLGSSTRSNTAVTSDSVAIIPTVSASLSASVTAATAVATSATSTPSSCAALAAAGSTFTSGSRSYTIDCNTDYPGDDMGNAPAASFEACLSACNDADGCVAVAYRAGVCYLKNGVPAAVATGVVDSGVLVTGASSAVEQIVAATGSASSVSGTRRPRRTHTWSVGSKASAGAWRA